MSKILLIVDDDEDVGTALARLLKPIFDRVIVVVDLASAIGVLRADPVDAVLCDYHLGGELTGEHLLASVALVWPRIRRVLHSGTRIIGPVAWAHAVLTKPAPPADIIRALIPSSEAS